MAFYYGSAVKTTSILTHYHHSNLANMKRFTDKGAWKLLRHSQIWFYKWISFLRGYGTDFDEIRHLRSKFLNFYFYPEELNLEQCKLSSHNTHRLDTTIYSIGTDINMNLVGQLDMKSGLRSFLDMHLGNSKIVLVACGSLACNDKSFIDKLIRILGSVSSRVTRCFSTINEHNSTTSGQLSGTELCWLTLVNHMHCTQCSLFHHSASLHLGPSQLSTIGNFLFLQRLIRTFIYFLKER